MEYFGVIGYPIGHSLSPVMHNAAFEHLGMDAVYHPFEVKSDRLDEAVKGASALGFTGLNVTIPFKESVLDYVEVKGVARKIGAVNTIDLKKMDGYNTDAYGAVKALEEAGVDVRDKAVLIVGAGGAAKAIAFGLAEKDARIVITNRTEKKGLELAEKVRESGDCFFQPFDRLEGLKVDVIINTTPLGMKGFDQKLPVPESIIKDVVVFDTVYNPQNTPLIALARDRGCQVVYGIDMLVHQGAEAFKIWTGREPPVKVMKEAALKKL
ncbi:MAG: shikimate dehydrogenase [Archaeoglobaceae archaeon]